MKLKQLLPVSFALVTACGNMTTPPGEIKPAYVSPLKYSGYTYEQLIQEKDALQSREAELFKAQSDRVEKSKQNAIWWGTGIGDGTEASELAQIRGSEVAVAQAIKEKALSTTAP